MSESTAAVSLGIDIGGTKIAATAVDADGQILTKLLRPTPEAKIAEQVASMVEEIEGQLSRPVASIGVGAAGFISADRSTVRFAPNIDWRDEPLGQDIARLTGLTTVVENDAAAAAWGEFVFGAGSDASDVLFVTVGTGVGGGIVSNGRLLRGLGAAAEIGHLRVVPDGIACGCGQYGCLEQYGSGTALVRDARHRAQFGDPGAEALVQLAGSIDEIDGPMVTDLAHQGDAFCIDVISTTARWLGQGIASLVAVLDPALVVIGGGVISAGDLLVDPVRDTLAEFLPAARHRPSADVVAATLGNNAGAIGAADLARRAATATDE